MFRYSLSYVEQKTPAKDLSPPANRKKYSIKPLNALAEKLGVAKDTIEPVFANNKAQAFWREFDPFRHEKGTFALLTGTMNISNAGLKCYEIIKEFDLIPAESKEVLHFDNAAFPGSFLVTTQYYTETQTGARYGWKASSLLEQNALNANPLEDKFKLYANYPENWLMGSGNNGDVLSGDTQRAFHKTLMGQVDLYTSDIGFDVSGDYNKQEEAQYPVNMGQILSGLLTLKPGGNLVTKQYTTLNATTIALMYATGAFFDEFYLCKPFTSREANSETYLVGKGFRGDPKTILEHPYIKAMFDRLEGRAEFSHPIFSAKDYPKKYLQDIVRVSRDLTTRQIAKIQEDVSKSLQGAKAIKHPGEARGHQISRDFRGKMSNAVLRWYTKMTLTPLPAKDRLNMRDAYRQQ